MFFKLALDNSLMISTIYEPSRLPRKFVIEVNHLSKVQGYLSKELPKV